MSHAPEPIAPPDLMAVIFEGLRPKTIKGMQSNLKDFARFLKERPGEDFTHLFRASPEETALRKLIGMDYGPANDLVAEYGRKLAALGFDPCTIRSRINTLGVSVDRARTKGLTTLRLDNPLPKPKDKAPRFTSAMWETYRTKAEDECRERPVAETTQILALILVLHDAALHLAEAIALRFPDDLDLSPDRPRIRVPARAKVRDGKKLVWEPITHRTYEALSNWVRFLTGKPGPLFDMSQPAIYRHMDKLARRAGFKEGVSPRDLRRIALREALATERDIRDVGTLCRLSVGHLNSLTPSEGATEPKTLAPLFQRPHPRPVILDGPGKPVFVLGNPKFLNKQQYNVINSLVDAEPKWLTEAELCTRSGHGGARKILVRLKKSDPDWAAIIDIRGGRGKRGSYRIIDPSLIIRQINLF